MERLVCKSVYKREKFLKEGGNWVKWQTIFGEENDSVIRLFSHSQTHRWRRKFRHFLYLFSLIDRFTAAISSILSDDLTTMTTSAVNLDEDISLIMIGERNVKVTTDSLILATSKKNFDMSSSKRRSDFADSIADVSETSLYNCENNVADKSTQDINPINFSGLTFKSTQQNSFFHKVSLVMFVRKQCDQIWRFFIE